MQPINSLFGDTKRFTTPKVKKGTSERGDLMEYFLSMLNPRRAVKGLPPLDYPRLGALLKGRDTQYLYYLKRVCDDSNNWSATFYTTLFPEKYDKSSRAPSTRNQ